MWVRVTLFSLVMAFTMTAYSAQTIVLIRHGEKPNNKSGQLTCKGLNRSLALPEILIKQFGKPDALFAAAPKQDKLGNSMRSIETISPTAIKVSLPIHLNYHAKEIAELQQDLLNERYKNSLIFVVWEHHNLVNIARNIMVSEGGDPNLIPKWKGDDFDSMYVLRIDHDNKAKMITFEHQQQNLPVLSDKCPLN